MTRRLSVSIGRLVLDGSPPPGRAAYERALRAALATSLAKAAAAGALGTSRSIGRLGGEGVAEDAAGLGRQVVARLRGDRR